jgi:hypothetical protein
MLKQKRAEWDPRFHQMPRHGQAPLPKFWLEPRISEVSDALDRFGAALMLRDNNTP